MRSKSATNLPQSKKIPQIKKEPMETNKAVDPRKMARIPKKSASPKINLTTDKYPVPVPKKRVGIATTTTTQKPVKNTASKENVTKPTKSVPQAAKTQDKKRKVEPKPQAQNTNKVARKSSQEDLKEQPKVQAVKKAQPKINKKESKKKLVGLEAKRANKAANKNQAANLDKDMDMRKSNPSNLPFKKRYLTHDDQENQQTKKSKGELKPAEKKVEKRASQERIPRKSPVADFKEKNSEARSSPSENQKNSMNDRFVKKLALNLSLILYKTFCIYINFYEKVISVRIN